MAHPSKQHNPNTGKRKQHLRFAPHTGNKQTSELTNFSPGRNTLRHYIDLRKRGVITKTQLAQITQWYEDRRP